MQRPDYLFGWYDRHRRLLREHGVLDCANGNSGILIPILLALERSAEAFKGVSHLPRQRFPKDQPHFLKQWRKEARQRNDAKTVGVFQLLPNASLFRNSRSRVLFRL